MSRAAVLAVVALAVALAATALPAWRHLREVPPTPPRPVQARWLAPEGVAAGAGPDFPFGLAVSPDGRRLAFPAISDGRVELWMQDLVSGETAPLPGTAGAALPFWSPDGSRVGFFTGATVRAFSLEGGTVDELLTIPAPPSPRGASWNRRGDLALAASDGQGLTLRTAGGDERPLTSVDRAAGERGHAFPMFLGDDEHVVYYVHADSPTRAGIWLTSTSGDATPVRVAGSAAHAVPVEDRLLLSVDGALVAQALDVADGRLEGRAVVLSPSVGHGPLGQLFATASSDVLIHAPPASSLRELVWVTPAGERVATLGAPADIWRVRIAPDGRRVLATVLEPLLRTLDVVLFDGLNLVPTRVSLSIDADDTPVWSPDGLRVAWVSAGRAIMIRGAGAVLPAEEVVRFDEPVQVTDWSADGRALLVSRRMAGTREDLWLVPIRGGGEPRALVATPFADVQGVLSPDGRWVAYASDEAGRPDIYVEGVPGRSPEPATRERVTSGGGSDPRWSRDGRSLFFRRGSAIHVATPALGRGPGGTAATSMVFETESDIRSFDVAPGGERFLLNVPVSSPPAPATLVVHWPR